MLEDYEKKPKRNTDVNNGGIDYIDVNRNRGTSKSSRDRAVKTGERKSSSYAARKRREQIRRKKRRAKIMVLATTLIIIAAVAVILKLFLFESSPVKDITVEAGSELPSIADFMEDKDKKPDSITGLEKENIMTTVGDYPVIITVEGKEWNAVLHVKDTIAPEVVAKTVVVYTNAELTPESFIETITDATLCETALETTPDTSAAGESVVTIIVTDAGGNETRVQSNLTVNADTEPPVIEGLSDIVVPVGGSVSYKKNVTVTDNSGEDIELIVDSSSVNISEIGTYEVRYSATDKSGNSTSKAVSLVVTEADAPTEDMVYELADQILADIINDSMTQKEQAEAIYWWVHDNVAYVDTAPKENWVAGAYRGLKERRGDCYTYAMTSKALLTRAGIKNMDIEKIPDSQMHYWNLIDVGEGWYHFDATRRKDGTTFFYWTTAQILEYSRANYNSHNYDASLYPEIN